MRWLRRLLYQFGALIFIAIGVLLIIHNPTRISLDLLLIQTPQMPFLLWLLAAFTLGMLGGYLAALIRRGNVKQQSPEKND